MLTGFWMVFVMLYLFVATQGIIGGLPMHLLGATFFILILLIVQLTKGGSSTPSKSDSGGVEAPETGISVGNGLDPRQIREQYRERVGMKPVPSFERNEGSSQETPQQPSHEDSDDEEMSWSSVPDLEDI
jgi:hypothetical protein